MLTLYHYWSSVCSQKVRMCLAEKNLEWQSRHVDIFAFENYEPAYTRLNPKAVVPTLDHNGRILIESKSFSNIWKMSFPIRCRSGQRIPIRARS
jgi:glutathione S-transferase